MAVNVDGTWSYKLDNSLDAVQDLGPMATLTETFTVTGSDGVATTSVTITINGADDTATLTASTGSVTEDIGVNDAGDLVATGSATTGGDASDDKLTAATLTGTHGGELAVDVDGTWSYKLDNSLDAVQDLGPMATLTETFTVTGSDGVATTSVTITINGADDTATLTASTGSVTEDIGVNDAGDLVATGSATTGGDASDDKLTAATLTGTHGGELAVDVDGTWSYKLDNSLDAVQDLGPMATLTETFTVTGSDGVATTSVTITINGADDTATLTASTGSVTEDIGVNDAGDLVATGSATTGGDASDDKLTAATLTGTHGGELEVNVDGTWSYKLDNSLDAVQDLGPMATLTETFTVTGSDGVATTSVTITINGADDTATLTASTGSVTEDIGVNDAGDLVATGSATTGGDASDDKLTAATLTGTHGGELAVDVDGTWSYKLDNSLDAVQDLGPMATLTETFTVTGSDGVATTSVTITINGADDTATLTASTGSVTEDIGVNDAGDLVATGSATTGGDASDDKLTAATLTGTHGGELEVNVDGTWSYKLDNSLDAVQDLGPMATLTETFTVTGSDGVATTSVTITINGADDTATLTASTGSVTEDIGVNDAGDLVATGSATTGGDASDDKLTAATLTGTHGGELAVDVDGTWSYKLDNSLDAVQDLGPMATLTETFTVTGSDGVATTSVTITINGADDTATLTASTGSVTEDIGVNDAGDLVATGSATTGGDASDDKLTAATLTGTHGGELAVDVDGTWSYKLDNSLDAVQDLGPMATLTETFTVTGSGGELAVDVDGTWSYKLDNSLDAVQDLGPMATLTETFTVTGSDGVATTSVTITINGADDTATLTASTGSVTEDIGVNDAGDLVATGSATTGGDASDDKLTAATLTGTHGGELAVDVDGTWSYKLDNSLDAVQDLGPMATLTETFTVTGSDGVATTSVTITINGADDTATLTASTGSVTEDIGVNDAGDLVATGSATTGGDASDDKLTAATLTGTYGGELAVDVDGTWSYKLDNSLDAVQDLGPMATLTETFTVTGSDGVATTSVTITINGADDTATLTASTGSVTEDIGVNDAGDLVATGTVTATGGDAGDTQFTAETITSSVGSLKIEADGDWTYTADNSKDAIQGLKAGATLTDTLTVTSADGATTTTVTITINGADDTPMLTGDTGTVTEDGNLVASGTVTATGGDAGDTQFTAETITSSVGSLKIEADGDWTYTADNSKDAIQGLKAGATLTDTLTVTSADGATTTTVTITINGADDTPMLTGDTGTVTEDGNLVASGTVTATGGDAGDTQFTAETITSSVGSLKIEADGDWTYTADNSKDAIQGLKAGATLTDTLTVTSADGATTTTVTITINGADDTPMLTGDTGTVTEDGNLVASGTVTATGGDAGDTQFTAETITSSVGSLKIEADGDWTYTADNSKDAIQGLKAGATLTDTLTVTSADGATTTTVTITINGADDTPMLTGDTGTVTEDGNLVASGTVTATGGDAGDTQFTAETITSSVGSLKIEADGDWTYTADNSKDAIQGLKAGATLTDTLTVTSADGATTTTVTITINGADDTPMLTGDTGTVTEDGNLVASGTVTATGGDAGDTQFTAETITSSVGSLKIEADGDWTYTADNSKDAIQGLKAGATLTDTLTVTSADGATTTTVTITINGADDTPMLTGDTGTVTEDGNLVASGTVTATGGDAGDTQFTAETITSSVGSLKIEADGDWTYTADNSKDAIQGLKADATLTDTLTVTSADGATTTTVSITINGADDAPVANDDTGATTENTPLTVADGDTGRAGGGAQRVNADLLENDVDLDGDTLTITEVAGDTDNVGSATAGTDENGNAGGSFTIHDDGSWSFDPGSDFNDLADGATRTTSVVYTISDNTVTDTATLTVTVTGVGDAPTANDDTGSTAENTPLTVADGDTGTGTTNADLLLNDTDPDGDDLTITEVAGDTANVGSATAGDNGGSFTIRADGSWRFDPGSDFDGLAAGATATTSVEYTASDGTLTDTATLTVTVTGEADAPSLTAAMGAVTEDSSVNAAGDLVASGTIGSSGGDTGNTQFRAETVTGDYGSLRIDASGDWRYTAANSQSAIQGLSATDSLSDAFTVTSADRVTTTTVTITINGADDTPSLTAATATLTEDTDVNDAGNLVAIGTVGSSGGDAGETRFRAETVTGDYGSLRIDASGDWRYTAANSQSAIQGLNAADSLSDAFTVTSADRVTTTTVTITINGADDVVLPPPAVNEAPTATDDAGSTVADTVLTVAGEATGSAGVNAGLLLNDSDPEGDRLSITTVAGFSRDAEGNYQPLQEAVAAGTPTLGSNGGQFTIEADGSWRFDPDSDFDDLAADATRTTALTYTVSDGNGGTDTATLTVTIRGAADVPPTLVTDTVVTGSAPTPEPALSTIDPAAPPSEAGLRSPDADEDADDEADSDNFLVPDQFWGTADDPDPVRLGISLDEQRIPAQGSSTIVLPSNTFVHVDPGTLIRVEASLEDGSDLPGYVIFDPDTLSFEVDGEAAAAAGVGEITVLLTGRDAAGNSDFGVFVINLRDVEEDTEDETGAGQLLPAADASPAATETDGGELEESGDAGSAATGAEDGAEDQTEADGNEPEQSDAKESEAGQASAENNEKDGQEQAAAQKNFDSQLEQVSRNNFMDSIEQLLEDVKTLLL